MKIRWKTLGIAVAIPLVVGGISAFISMRAMDDFEKLNQPALSPPGWLFPVAWTILYILMGIASYLVFRGGASEKDTSRALKVYAFQLGLNFLWSIIFFNLSLYTVAFVELILLWLTVLLCTILFYGISKPSAYLMIPYILWLTFAAYLNLSIILLN